MSACTKVNGRRPCLNQPRGISFAFSGPNRVCQVANRPSRAACGGGGGPCGSETAGRRGAEAGGGPPNVPRGRARRERAAPVFGCRVGHRPRGRFRVRASVRGVRASGASRQEGGFVRASLRLARRAVPPRRPEGAPYSIRRRPGPPASLLPNPRAEIDSWFEGNRLVVRGKSTRGSGEIDSWFGGNRLVVRGKSTRGLREVSKKKPLQNTG